MSKGYGAGITKAEINFKLPTNLYYSYIRSIIYRAFLKLTEVIADQCKLKLIESGDYITYKFKSWLCRYTNWLVQEDIDTFGEFVRSVYDLDAKSITKGQAIQLYKAILFNWFAVKNDLFQN